MTINDLELSLIEVPRIGSGQLSRSLLVRLGTDEGLDGWGETPCLWRAEEIAKRTEVLGKVLIGRQPHEVEDLLRLEILREPGLRCAVEMACWDTIARGAAAPLCHLLGGTFRNHVPLAVRLSESTRDAMIHLARELADQSIPVLIVPGGAVLEDDPQLISELTQLIGDRVELILDAAGRWTFDHAAAACRALELQRLKNLLDPLAASELSRLGDLAAQTRLPLAVSQCIHHSRDALMFNGQRDSPSLVIHLDRVGGITAARKCAAVAEAVGLSVSLAAPASGGIAAAALLHTVAATPQFASSNECGYLPLQEDVLSEPMELGDGMLTVPSAAGLGVEVDRAKLERYQVG